MDPIVVTAVVVVLFVVLAIRHRSAKDDTEKFDSSVELYNFNRDAQIAQGADPSSIPTAEEFLYSTGHGRSVPYIKQHKATVGALPKNNNTNSVYKELKDNSAIRNKPETIKYNYYAVHTDRGYAAFVAEMWSTPGVNLNGITLQRATELGPSDCTLYTLVVGANGSTYINLVEDGIRKTYADDDRHEWYRDGQRVNTSSFTGIMRGAVPDKVLIHEAYASSPIEALSAAYDRFETTARRFVIEYAKADGEIGFRVISRVTRRSDRVYADCHFRYGERRTFIVDRILNAWDDDLEPVPVAALWKRSPLPG